MAVLPVTERERRRGSSLPRAFGLATLLSFLSWAGACGSLPSEEESPALEFEVVNASRSLLGLPPLQGFGIATTEGETRQRRDGALELEPGSRVVYRALSPLAGALERELLFDLYTLSYGLDRGTRRLRLSGGLPWKVEVAGEGLGLVFYPEGVELEVVDVREVIPHRRPARP